MRYVTITEEGLASLEKAAERYAKVRKMQPHEWLAIYHANLKGEGTFDELVDRWEGRGDGR